MAQRSRGQQAAVAEIGPLPPIGNRSRRQRCRRDLERFLVRYFPCSTGLKPFSEDHRRVIARIQRCCLEGGRYCNALPRGYGKTTITQNAALWAVLYGHRRYLPIFAANARAAQEILDSIKLECELNELLLADFPEACYPIRALERKTQRCKSQTYLGRPTYIEWTAEKIVFPTTRRGTRPAACNGAVVSSHGLSGAIRGLVHKRADGRQQRPDFVLIDDPQDDESAHSPLQVQKSLRLISHSILRLGGHRSQLAIVISGTVIAREDLLDQLLDTARYPAWQGERIPMVRQWSQAHDKLWLDSYAQLRRTYDPQDPEDQIRAHRRANDFYRQHREEMAAGAEVSWEHCFDEQSEESAIQHAYNILIDDGPESFAAECQNRPQEAERGEGVLEAKQICQRLSKRPQGHLATACAELTAQVDVHDRALFWSVVGYQRNFSGELIDYGIYPPQPGGVFALRDCKRTLGRRHPGKGKEGAILAGLLELIQELFSREWPREDGQTQQIGLGLIDAGYLPDVVHEAIRLSGQAARLRPSLGRAIGPAARPMSEYTYKPGDRRGLNYGMFRRAGRRMPIVEFDANYWKSRLRDRLISELGEPGCLLLFGKDPRTHRGLAHHLTAEQPVPVAGPGRKLEQWKQPPGCENHWWDSLVGTAVAAAILGCRLPGMETSAKSARSRKRIRYLD